MATYHISDIHGCHNTFQELLSTIAFNKSDKLFLLGDYINRGPRSKELVQSIISLQKEGYTITALLGNHEQMIFDAFTLDDWVGGEPETLQSFGITHWKELDTRFIRWFKKLSYYEKCPEYIQVHAGLNFKIEDPLENHECMMWENDWYHTINYKWLGKRKIIHGHKPVSENFIRKQLDNFETAKVLNIDNGVFLSDQKGMGSLCCFNSENKKLHFQKNIDF